MPRKPSPEALALIEYAERNRLLIAVEFDEYKEEHDPEALYTAGDLRKVLAEQRSGVDYLASKPTDWRLVDPQVVLTQLEQTYLDAKGSLERFRDKLARL